MNRLEIIEARNRFTQWKGYFNIFVDSCRGMVKYKTEVENKVKYGIYDSDYQTLTNKVNVDIEIGKNRKECKIEDAELIKRFENKYKCSENEIIYTDGSFKKESKSTGVGIIREDCEIAYTISVNSKYSSYTVEIIAIEKTISMAIELDWDKDLLILSDCQSACVDIRSNKINIKKIQFYYKNQRKDQNL